MMREILSRTRTEPTHMISRLNVWFSNHLSEERSSRLKTAMPECAADLKKLAEKIRRGVFYYDGPNDTYYCVFNKLYVCVLKKEPDPLTDKDGLKAITCLLYTSDAADE